MRNLNVFFLTFLVATQSYADSLPASTTAATSSGLSSVTLNDYLTLIALLLGPTIGVVITIWYQRRQEKRRAELWILGSLVSNRHQIFGSENVKAMNTIDVVFAHNAKVREAWGDFVDAARNQNVDATFRLKAYNALVDAMCATLGYGESMRYVDLERVVFDPGVLRAQTIEQGFLELIRIATAAIATETGKKALPMDEKPKSDS